jgi:hypothetical protein
MLVADVFSQDVAPLEIPLRPSSSGLERYDDDSGFGDDWMGLLEVTTQQLSEVIIDETDRLHNYLAGNLSGNLEITTV